MTHPDDKWWVSYLTGFSLHDESDEEWMLIEIVGPNRQTITVVDEDADDLVKLLNRGEIDGS